VQGVYIHYNEGGAYDYKIPEERLPEINIPTVTHGRPFLLVDREEFG
jgi:hypothetical protein